MLGSSHKAGKEPFRKVPPPIRDIADAFRFENVEACADEIALSSSSWRFLDKLHYLIMLIENCYAVRGRILNSRQRDRHLTSMVGMEVRHFLKRYFANDVRLDHHERIV